MKTTTRRDWTALVAVSMLTAIVAGCGGVEPESPQWRRFRGPNGQGISPETDLPVRWAEDGTGVRWTAEIPGPGVSSPIVSNWQVVLSTESSQGDDVELGVMSLDLRTGEQLWKTTVVTRQREVFPQRSVNNSSSGATPTTDGETVFAYFGSHLAALDFSGQVVWLQEIDPKYLKEAWYGAGSSLVVADDKIIVFRDREKDKAGLLGWIAAYDKKSGERLWQRKWDDTCCSYTTPIVLEGESGTEILVTQARRLVSFDAETGKRRWRVGQEIDQPVGSPLTAGDTLCSASGAHGTKNVACWQLRANSEGRMSPKMLWNMRRGVNSISTAILYNGLLFSVTDYGGMYCWDPSNGRTLWRNRIGSDGFSASLIAGDDKVYVFSRFGPAWVVAAKREFELLAENDLPHKDVVATPAIADGCLLVRTRDHLMCVEGSEFVTKELTDQTGTAG